MRKLSTNEQRVLDAAKELQTWFTPAKLKRLHPELKHVAKTCRTLYCLKLLAIKPNARATADTPADRLSLYRVRVAYRQRPASIDDDPQAPEMTEAEAIRAEKFIYL